MDDDQKLKELLAKAYDSAPQYVQTFLDDDKLADFMLDFQAQMKVHADVATDVSNRILLTLLGVTEPGELPAELRDAGLPEELIAETIQRVNRDIFVPLQEAAHRTSIPAASVGTPAPRAQASSAPATPIVAPPSLVRPMPPSASTLPEPGVLPALPTAPLPTRPSVPVPPPAPAWAPPAEPAMRTMAHDVETMKEGGTPAPMHYGMPSPPPTAPPPVAADSVPLPVPPPNAPYIPPAPMVPSSQITIPPEIAKTRVPDIHEVTSTLKKYGIDPYREPPE